MADYQHVPGYEDLPESIKVDLSAKEYAWLGQTERDRLIERETVPDMEDFGD